MWVDIDNTFSEVKNITVKVLLFGACRETAGTGELVLDIDDGVSAFDAWSEVKRIYPDLERYEKSALLAVNEEHSPWDRELEEGDTIAIFPPVSGG